MKNRTSILIVVVLIATLVTATPAFAYWSSLTVELRDSKTNSAWTHGGSVTVYDLTAYPTIMQGPVAIGASGIGTVSSLSDPVGPVDRLLVEITFTGSTGGTPATKWLVIQSPGASNDGALTPNLIVYTDTGPTAVTLANAEAQSPNVWLVVALAVGVLIGAAGVALFLRKRRIA